MELLSPLSRCTSLECLQLQLTRRILQPRYIDFNIDFNSKKVNRKLESTRLLDVISDAEVYEFHSHFLNCVKISDAPVSCNMPSLSPVEFEFSLVLASSSNFPGLLSI